MGGLGVSGGMAWTMRTDSLELWRDLVLHGMGEVDFHVFWKYWKLTSSPNTSKLVLGSPGWFSDFFESQGTISGTTKPMNFPKKGPQHTYFPGNWEDLICRDNCFFCNAVLWFFWSPTPLSSPPAPLGHGLAPPPGHGNAQ